MQVCHAPFSRFLPPSDGVTSGLILPTEMITTASSSDLHACNHTPTHYIRSEAARLITSHNCPTDHVTCTLLSKNTRSFPNVPALPLRVPPTPNPYSHAHALHRPSAASQLLLGALMPPSLPEGSGGLLILQDVARHHLLFRELLNPLPLFSPKGLCTLPSLSHKVF